MRHERSFPGKASTWLYQVATSCCLHALRSASRRPPMSGPDLALPEPTRAGEVAWLEPYPDVLLDGLADLAPGPEARYEARDASSPPGSSRGPSTAAGTA